MQSGITQASPISEATGCKAASDCIYSAALSAGVAKRIAVPSGARLVKISAPADVFVRWHATADAIVPVADDLAGNAAERNPFVEVFLRGLTSFSVISATAQTITLTWWG